MNNMELLDCTLRDGGYINDWNFGYNTICSIVKNLIKSNVNLIELGFLRDCTYNKDKTLFNNVSEAMNIIPKEKGDSKFVLMALHNMYDIEKLEYNDGTIEAIRVTFHDYDIEEGLEFCQKVIDKGYKCYCNPINIMGYDDVTLLQLLKKINKFKPYGFSIVDTFGSMRYSDLLRIYSLCENNLDKSITIGLHLHENMSMAFSLAQSFMKIVSPVRNYVIDASLYGMGRVPGNLCIELIMDYCNYNYGTKYNIESVLDAIDNHISNLKAIEPWGYSTAYFLSAKYNLHRNYAEYLLSKGKLTTKDINDILQKIKDSKKSAFDKDYIEKLYIEYQDHTVNDNSYYETLKNIVENKSILILAPGKSIKTYNSTIKEFIELNNPIVFSTNFYYNELNVQYAFFTNIKRFNEYYGMDTNSKTIITSNIDCKTVDFIFNYSSLAHTRDGRVFDNCAIMLIELLTKLNCKMVYLAGFDGFSKKHNDYDEALFNEGFGAIPIKNEDINYELKLLSQKIEVKFLTPSMYQI